jgi:hypothetical protein
VKTEKIVLCVVVTVIVGVDILVGLPWLVVVATVFNGNDYHSRLCPQSQYLSDYTKRIIFIINKCHLRPNIFLTVVLGFTERRCCQVGAISQ